MKTSVSLYLDCDTGIDDALALTYLLNTPAVDLVGIGTVSGNTSSEEAAVNTAALLALADRSEIPVAVGAHDPIAGSYRGGAPDVHGSNGVGDVALSGGAAPVAETAPHMIVRLARTHPGKLDVVAIGPLTNLAKALELDPTLPNLVSTLTIMGGAVWVPGNITAAAEANIFNDAEAARRVFRAGFRINLVPLDVTLQHRFDDGDADLLARTGSDLHIALGQMLHRYIDFYESVDFIRRAPLHDPLAAAIAAGEVTPTQIREVPLDVVLESANRGQTVPVDTPGDPLVRVIVAAQESAATVILDRIMASAVRTAPSPSAERLGT
ncbi:nucleoside hydrolase [Sinomonas sp. JGH33]|uniref:Nucleoside hydrolase n=1 Tax=Sinomonas terricola TaxID=3110330 RepID=A0ABU5T8K6_9MICC|nr:nucleoside hydrolase [Sinomonas sp. JGH33]MEA5455992.1 nucleoside hydrolase [Sinomonas sp. JGH33]